ncbi:MAG: NlpC/P60 family protein [Chloroflexota bacterium]
MPPVIRRRGALGVALALALSVCAVAAPGVSANTTSSADQTGAGAFEWTGTGDAFADAPIAEARTSNPVVGWHDTSNTSGRIEQRPEAAAKPQPRPTQTRSDARKIIRLARNAVGADFRMGAVGGGNNYDCSGLVYSVYKDAGLLSRVGGSRRGATSFYNWFKSRGLVSRKNGKPGDLVVYQHKGEGVIPHMGIYIGNGRVISALVNPWGVRTHGLNRIGIPFKAFLHVRIER